MSRPRVLCVSNDRSTRASVTLSLTDAPVDVVVAQSASEGLERLERQSIDAVLIDASTIANVPTLVDAVESASPETPMFVHWGDSAATAASDSSNGPVAVLSEVVARIDDTDRSDRLADAITARIDADSSDDVDSEEAFDDTGFLTAETAGSSADRTRDATGLSDDFAAIVAAVRRRLVDVTSPIAVERVLREEFTASDRFAFAWVGEYDRGEREVVPWLTDPDDMEWPMQRTFSIGEGDQPLLERAMRSRKLQTLRDVADNRDAVPFGDHVCDRDVHAVAAAPLASKDELYGVFVVYATEPITDAERTAIRSAAAVGSHVLETIAIRGRLEQRERALHRYERLVETAGDGMYVLDEQGHFMTVNDALTEMTGYSREGLLGEHVSIVFDRADTDAGEETIRALLEDDASTDTVELRLETKAGDTIPCEAQIAVLVPDEEFLGSVAVIRDITERKRDERRLREQNERLDAFARIVSHDLRNPLGVAQGYLDLLEETESLEHAENVRDGLDRMETIIEDVLAIARDGDWVTDTEPVDLESVAVDAWEHVSTEDATLSVAETTTIEADRSRLLRLFENLFRNSIEHGGTDVSVRIGLLESDGFYLEDDGAGIPEARREKLFDPSVSSSESGLGIGLWVVKEVATGHGWTVTATEGKSESGREGEGGGEREDGGARFEFAFDSSDRD
ncbi:PAS domain S-box protein [Natronorubrum sp. JWXQ-INN-674]|uniref:histidine kinase n=1 Tax=Natronorubrum halalkaliphilum TaxID=2691917 RepID=A0A6B0VS53_9EURY|nr:PAS domain S-box protein [Natronorubrum halalkaliphilum]MXV63963.1 PAS domain S-box protein [Natronorubrum halalkaliphilum]